ncbi:cyclin-U4-1-like [Malania oleifera]|uniref:cyclin-U4-1-like n=1 Tax=Malania oleifera TaxID=397392 RepID=UPI0025AE5C2C|nr:cyclin-U4-1-like [Malania oleifera]
MADFQNPAVMPNLITSMSSLLQRVADSNDLNRQLFPQKISVFHSLTRPTISIQSYLERIFKYANCSPSCFLVAYVYLDRFSRHHPSLPINSLNVHRLLITSVMVAAKFLDDIYYNNAHYAKIGGISTAEMNFLEVDFLYGLGFHLNVTPISYNTYCSYLHAHMLMLQSPLHFPLPESPPGFAARSSSLKLQYLCFNEDESSHKEQQLAA